MVVTQLSVTAQIHIQGPKVLEFVSLDNEQAQFNMVGITEPKIRVIDYRPAVRRKMREILQTKKVEQLVDYINRPARVTILPPEPNSQEYVVQLHKTRAKKPRHMLWLAVGISGAIPFYDFTDLEIQPWQEQTFALFSLYKRPSVIQE